MTKKASPDDPKIIRLAPDEEPLDPFGDPSKLVMSQDFAREAGVEKLLTVVPVRKPKPHEFVQVHPDQQFRLTPTAIVDLKDEGEIYFVLPHLAQDLMGEYRMMTLHLAITRQGVVFIWPVPLPDASSGRKQIWAESVNEAAAQAMRAWVRVKWNKALGAYEITKAASSGCRSRVAGSGVRRTAQDRVSRLRHRLARPPRGAPPARARIA